MTEDRAFAASEDRRHPKTVITQSVMAYGIDTAMNAVQAAGRDAATECAGGDPDGFELPRRNDPVLARGYPGNEDVQGRFVAFCPHVWEEGDKRPDLAPFIAGVRP